jgi:hypothetical protein
MQMGPQVTICSFRLLRQRCKTSKILVLHAGKAGGCFFMPQLARYLQDSFEQNCPKGSVCRTEVNVVSDELSEILGYEPQADAMLQEVATGRRVWVELVTHLAT